MATDQNINSDESASVDEIEDRDDAPDAETISSDAEGEVLGVGDDINVNSGTTNNEPDTYTPRSVNLIDNTLQGFYREFQSHITEYGDMEPREAFVQYMIDQGVEFPESTKDFGDTDTDAGVHGVVTGGQCGATAEAIFRGMDHNAGLVDGFHDRRRGWQLNGRTIRDPVLRVVDTEDVAEKVEQAAPNDAAEMVEAMLADYDFIAERGSGNDVTEGLKNLLQRPDYLKWVFNALTEEGQSVLEVVAGLGGGTGTALAILIADWARIGIVGLENQSLGFTTTIQMGRSQNDVHLGTFDDGSPRYTWHDGLAAEWSAAQQVHQGNADWSLQMDNLSLTYSYVGLTENPALPQVRRFFEPVRSGDDPGKVERRIIRELDDGVNNHTNRNRVIGLSTWPFRRLLERDAAVKFNAGEERYDDEDFRTDFHGNVMTPAFDAVHAYEDEFDDRGIPRFDGVNGHKDALHAISHTAAALPTAFVSFDEVQGANVVVHAADMEIGLDELGLIEEEVADELNLNDGGRSVRAINMDGLTAERFPGGYPLALAVYIKHAAPVDAHIKMASEDYNRRVNGGE